MWYTCRVLSRRFVACAWKTRLVGAPQQGPHIHDVKWATVASASTRVRFCVFVLCVSESCRAGQTIVRDSVGSRIQGDGRRTQNSPQLYDIVHGRCRGIQPHAIEFTAHHKHTYTHTHTDTHTRTHTHMHTHTQIMSRLEHSVVTRTCATVRPAQGRWHRLVLFDASELSKFRTTSPAHPHDGHDRNRHTTQPPACPPAPRRQGCLSAHSTRRVKPAIFAKSRPGLFSENLAGENLWKNTLSQNQIYYCN